MASFSPLLLLISLSALLILPSQSADCPPAKFKNNKSFSNCTALSILSSYLHYTYNASNSSLAVAFIAKPPMSGGWIAWAINPSGTKMPGSQAIVASTKEDGTPMITTLNIKSYHELIPGNLSFDVWDTSAELTADGNLTLFATVKVPEKAETLNQVWQVGPRGNQTNGYIMKHEMGKENLAAYGLLRLAGTGSTNTTNTTSGGAASPTSAKSGAPLRIREGGHVGLFSILLLVLGTLLVF